MTGATAAWEDWLIPRVIQERARSCPDETFVSLIGGDALSYRELHEAGERVATFLAASGVVPGDRIIVMLPTGLEFLYAWAGICRLGAVMVALNPELSGAFLAHQVNDADSRLIIAHSDFIPEIRAQMGSNETIILSCGGSGSNDFDGWRKCVPYAGDFPKPSDIACIMYTSGTTGPAKGVLMPHAHCYLFGLGTVENLGLEAHDHYYVTLPLFHANGLFMQLAAVLIAGATASVRARFSASNWISDIRGSGATITNMLGATSAFISAQPPRFDDRDHCLRLIASAPNQPDHERMWRDRFGVAEVIGLYGMTEVNIPLYTEPGCSKPGTCGRVYASYFEVEVRDPNTDERVETGAVGEIMVRPRVPFGFMAGYHGLPAKTVEAWRNLWFHTGDAGKMDVDGYVTFVDRIKDCIRRRGENISSFEVEAAIGSLDGVKEVAAFAVPSEIDGGEDEIMIAYSGDAAPEPVKVAVEAQRMLPRYAWPRFFERLDELPKTSTGKIRKDALRAKGVSAITTDTAS